MLILNHIDWARQANPNNNNLTTLVMYVILLTCASKFHFHVCMFVWMHVCAKCVLYIIS